MIFRFNDGLKKGIDADKLLDKTNKNFIGNGLIEVYKSDKDAITKILSEKAAEISGNNENKVPLYSEEKYGSVENWLNSREYLEYKFPGKKKLRLDIESVAKETTQEEFDSASMKMNFKLKRRFNL